VAAQVFVTGQTSFIASFKAVASERYRLTTNDNLFAKEQLQIANNARTIICFCMAVIAKMFIQSQRMPIYLPQSIVTFVFYNLPSAISSPTGLYYLNFYKVLW
jgi:hypothetical protein